MKPTPCAYWDSRALAACGNDAVTRIDGVPYCDTHAKPFFIPANSRQVDLRGKA